jgi:ornithine lipid ester-linked acyl 2-hydroxylase
VRAALLTPPSIRLPAPPDAALADWAGAFRERDVATVRRDLGALNLLRAADDVVAKSFLARVDERFGARRRSGQAVVASWLQSKLRTSGPNLLSAESFRRDLVDPSRYFDPAVFRNAFDGLADAYEFLFGLETDADLATPGAEARLVEVLAHEPWTATGEILADLFDAGAWSDFDLLVFRARDGVELVSALRIGRSILRCGERPQVLLTGPAAAAAWGDGRAPAAEIFDACDAIAPSGDAAARAAVVAALRLGRGVAEASGVAYRDQDGRSRVRGAAPQFGGPPPPPKFDAADTALFAPRAVYGLRFGGRGAEPSSPEVLAAAARALVSDVGATAAMFEDDVLDPSQLANAADVLGAAAPTLRFGASTFVGAEFLDPSFARRLAEGGCRSLALRVGAAADRPGERRLSLDDLSRALDFLSDAGVVPDPSWTVGGDGETRRDALAFVRFLAERRERLGAPLFLGVDPRATRRRPADPSIPDWMPAPCEGSMLKEEAKPLAIMLARFDRRAVARTGAHLLYAIEGRRAAETAPPLKPPREFEAFCTPHEVEPSAPPSSFSAAGEQVVFHDDFGFRSRLEAAYERVRAEWFAMPESARIVYRDRGAVEGYWAHVGFYGAGLRVRSACERSPALAEILDSVPGIYTAGWSIVGPKSRVVAHSGEDRTLLRCHLPLDVPKEAGFVVGGLKLEWKAGRTLVFDDTLPHVAWNDSDVEKVLLLIDFRPKARIAQGLDTSDEQRARDLAHYVHLFPEWADDSDPRSKTVEA